MPRTRFGGVGIPDDDEPTIDAELAVEVEAADEDVAEQVARYARNAGVRALQAFASNKHPDEVDFTDDVAVVDWDTVLEARDPKGSTDEDGEDDAGSDE